MSASGSDLADYSGDPGDLIVSLHRLYLGPDEEMFFPGSIDASMTIGIPEPATLGLLGIGAVGLLSRRKQNTSRRRASC